jgi:DNA-binding LacI/PurR family transcriptional regulator
VREAAWREALAAAGLAPGPVASADTAAPDTTATGSRERAGSPRAAARALLRHEPTAIVCASDALAIEAVAAARAAGLDVPGDVSVVGFDDSALGALASPALTSVRVDYGEFGEAAAQALLACIDGEPPPGYVPSAPELVVRASTGRVSPRWRSES